MKLALFSTALTGIVSLGAVSEACAWSRTSTVTTNRGTYTHSVTGSCHAGACSRSATLTGPNGRTASRTGSVTRIGPYHYAYTRTTTGFGGASITRGGSFWHRPFRRW